MKKYLFLILAVSTLNFKPARRRLILLLLAGGLQTLNCFSQTPERQVISSSGGDYSNTSLQFNFTIGEAVVQTFQNSGLILTQGFQQPSLSTQNCNLTLTVTVVNSTCNQQNGSATVSVSGGTQPYRYAWTSGDTLATADSLAAGLYMLTVTDSLGCSASAMATVSNTNGPSITAHTIINATCFGSANGAINITVSGGATPYTFLWSNGAATQNISGLSAAAICTPAACGNNNGAALITVTGGVQLYFYSWNNGLSTQQSDTLSPGVYIVTVTDANSCSASPLMISINTVNGTVVTIDSIIQTGCSGNAGAIYVSVSGGNQPYTYNWSDTSNTQDITQLSAGNYQLTVTDSSGCIGTIAATISYTQLTVPQICIVTVDSIENKNLIVWEKEITTNIHLYNIYREGSWAGYYYLAGSKLYDSVSQFLDVNSNPKMRAYRY
ncbi:MAG: SprB repeat-containing protein [Bacteroidia bacterium]|nr:SprB repeat-containing protein [Bacteroidia bacterium]